MARATEYGRILVTELAVGDERATFVGGRRAGGVAGGHKREIHGLFFKLAADSDPAGDGHYIYGGRAGPDEEKAAKAAGHELRAAVHCSSAVREIAEAGGLPAAEALRVAMQCLIELGGHRLVVQAVLPIEPDRLVYGSRDGGRTVHASSPLFNRRMAELAGRMHLAEHMVAPYAVPGPAAGRAAVYSRYAPSLSAARTPYDQSVSAGAAGAADAGARLHWAGDVEGHIGLDGRLYVLDLARSFPPEAPVPHLPEAAQTMDRLLRSEFVTWLRARGFPPLNPDALSRWGSGDPLFAEHNQRVRDATALLLDEVVPRVAAQWAAAGAGAIGQSDVGVEMHRAGISVRHAGLLRSLLPRGHALRRTLLVEVVARTLKNVLRCWLRGAGTDPNSPGRLPSEFSLRLAVVGFANLVSGAHPRSEAFWADEVEAGVRRRFGSVALDGVAPGAGGLFQAVRGGIPYMLGYVLSYAGVALTPACLAAAAASPPVPPAIAGGTPPAPVAAEDEPAADEDASTPPCLAGFSFTHADLVSAPPRVKFMSERVFAEGALYRQAARDSPAGAPRMLRLSADRLGDALRSQPSSREAMRDLALVGVQLHEANGDAAAGDAALLAHLERALRAGAGGEAAAGSRTLRDVAQPLLERLLTTWASRRGAPGPPSLRSFPHCGGASSLAALQRADAALSLYERRGGPAAPAMRAQLRLAWQTRYAAVLCLFGRLEAAGAAHDAPLLRRLAAERAPRDFVYTDAASRMAPLLHADQAAGGCLWRILREAAAAGDPATVGLLREFGVSPDTRHPETGETALVGALLRGRLGLARALLELGATGLGEALARVCGDPEGRATADAVALLLDAGAPANARDPERGETPLLTAARAGAPPEVVALLLERGASRSARVTATDSAELGWTPLQVAARHARAGIAARLLEAAGTPDPAGALRLVRDRTPGGLTAAHLAAAAGHAEVLAALAAAGALEPALRATGEGGDAGQTALHLAAAGGHLEAARVLARAAGALQDEADARGRTALHAAVAAGHEEVARYLLLEEGASPLAADLSLSCPLHAAAAAGHAGLVRLLAGSGGAEVEARNASGATPLAVACAAGPGRAEAVRALLELGADATCLDDRGRSTLHAAAEAGADDALRLVLGAAAAAGEQQLVGARDADQGNTAAHLACEGDHPACLTLLAEAGADVAGALNDNKSSPLHVASYHGSVGCVRVLVAGVGVDVNQPHDHKKSPLLYAAWRGHLGVVRVLLQHGADPAAAEKDGKTPLIMASWGGHDGIVLELLDSGLADPNAVDTMRRSPLMWAAQYGRASVVRLLLARGANPLWRAAGRTAVAYARMAGFHALVPLLESAEAAAAESPGGAVFESSDGRAAGEDSGLRSPPASTAAAAAQRSAGSALAYAAYHGLHLVAAALLNAGADPDAPPSRSLLRRDPDEPSHRLFAGRTALLVAAERGHAQVVRALLEGGANLLACLAQSGASALMLAAGEGHLETCRALLEADAAAGGALRALRSKWGGTAVHSSVQGGNPAVLLALMEGRDRAEADQPDADGFTPLLLAAQAGSDEMAAALLQVGADPCAAFPPLAQTALHAAAEGGAVAVLRRLAEAGAPVTQADADGETPLMRAARRGRAEAVAALLEAGAGGDRVDDADASGRTALAHAAEAAVFSDTSHCARLLVEAGADPARVGSASRARPAAAKLLQNLAS